MAPIGPFPSKQANAFLYVSSCLMVVIIGLMGYIIWKKKSYQRLAHQEPDMEQPHDHHGGAGAVQRDAERGQAATATVNANFRYSRARQAHRFDVEHGRPLHASDPSILPPSNTPQPPMSSSFGSINSSRNTLTSIFERGTRQNMQPPVELRTFRSYN